VALFGLASVLLFAPMRRDAGAEVSGHGKAPEGAALRSGD
jgi:hypothetical protein